jgi:hypothetical protein
LEKAGVDRRIILKYFINKQGERVCGLDSSGSQQERMVGFRELDNELQDSIQGREFIEYLSDY